MNANTNDLSLRQKIEYILKELRKLRSSINTGGSGNPNLTLQQVTNNGNITNLAIYSADGGGLGVGLLPDGEIQISSIGDGNSKVKLRADYLTSTYTLQFPDKTGDQTFAMLSDLSGLPTKTYKVYSALVSQSGTGNPTVKVLEDDFGTIITQYNNVGLYYFIDTNAGFTTDKTVMIVAGGENVFTHNWSNINNLTTAMQTKNLLGVNTDGLLANTFIEIRVYN